MDGPRIEKGKVPEKKDPALRGSYLEIVDFRPGAVETPLAPAVNNLPHLPAAALMHEGDRALICPVAAVARNMNVFIIHDPPTLVRSPSRKSADAKSRFVFYQTFRRFPNEESSGIPI